MNQMKRLLLIVALLASAKVQAAKPVNVQRMEIQDLQCGDFDCSASQAATRIINTSFGNPPKGTYELDISEKCTLLKNTSEWTVLIRAACDVALNQ